MYVFVSKNKALFLVFLLLHCFCITLFAQIQYLCCSVIMSSLASLVNIGQIVIQYLKEKCCSYWLPRRCNVPLKERVTDTYFLKAGH